MTTQTANETQLTESEKLERDIAGIRESIRLNWVDLDRLNLSPEERAGIRENTRLLTDDLKALIERLERLEGRGLLSCLTARHCGFGTFVPRRVAPLTLFTVCSECPEWNE